MGSVKGDKGIKTEQDGNLKVQKEKSNEKKRKDDKKKMSSMYCKGCGGAYKM